MEIVPLLIMTASNILCFLVGARTGQKVTKGETVEVPTVNPMEAFRQKEAQKEAKREKDIVDTILRNIDNYDGTGQGQEDVPR